MKGFWVLFLLAEIQALLLKRYGVYGCLFHDSEPETCMIERFGPFELRLGLQRLYIRVDVGFCQSSMGFKP